MRFLMGLLIIAALCWGGWKLYDYWGNFKPKEETPVVVQPADTTGQSLPGMLPKLEPVLDAARRRGAPGLHDFLTMYGNTISDPRRAWIELDYVVLLSQSSPGDARKEFAKVKNRVTQDSPVYPRVKQLEKTYE
jgi:hypothetical protein